MTSYFILLFFFVYGFLGWCLEVAFAAFKQRQFVNRGFLYGPICPIYGIGVMIVILFLDRFSDQWLILYVASIVLVTLLEWVTGFLLEKIFHARWWDYSNMPLNIGGYVCLLFSLLWGVACVLIVKVIHPIFFKFFGILPKGIGWVILVLLAVVFAADLYLTVAGILKMNRRLANMERIGEELHRISNELGESIYENVMEAIDRKEEFDLKSKEASEEMQARIEELKQRYAKASMEMQRKNRRLLRAFPKLDPSQGKKAMEQLRRRIEERTKPKN